MSEVEALLKHCGHQQYYKRLMDANISTFAKMQEKKDLLGAIITNRDHLQAIVETLGTRGLMSSHSSASSHVNTTSTNININNNKMLHPTFASTAAAAAGAGSSSSHFFSGAASSNLKRNSVGGGGGGSAAAMASSSRPTSAVGGGRFKSATKGAGASNPSTLSPSKLKEARRGSGANNNNTSARRVDPAVGDGHSFSQSKMNTNNNSGINSAERQRDSDFGNHDDDNDDDNSYAFSTAKFRFDENYDHNDYLFDRSRRAASAVGDGIDLLYDELISWHRQLMTKLRLLGLSRAEALTQRSNVVERGGKISLTVKKGEFKRLQTKYDHMKTLLAMTRNAMKQHRRNIELLKLCRRQTNKHGDPAQLTANEAEVQKGQEMVKNILVVLQEDGPTLMNIDVVHFGANGERYYDEADDEVLAEAGYISPEKRRQRQIDDEEEELARKAEREYNEMKKKNKRQQQQQQDKDNMTTNTSCSFSSSALPSPNRSSRDSRRVVGSRINQYLRSDGQRTDSLGNVSGKSVKEARYPPNSLNPKAPNNKNKRGDDDDDDSPSYVDENQFNYGDNDDAANGNSNNVQTEWINIGDLKRPIFMSQADIDAVFNDDAIVHDTSPSPKKANGRRKRGGTSDKHGNGMNDFNDDNDNDNDDEGLEEQDGVDEEEEEDDDETKAKRRKENKNARNKDKQRIHALLQRIKGLEEERWRDNDAFQKESLRFYAEKERMERLVLDLQQQLRNAHDTISKMQAHGVDNVNTDPLLSSATATTTSNNTSNSSPTFLNSNANAAAAASSYVSSSLPPPNSSSYSSELPTRRTPFVDNHTNSARNTSAAVSDDAMLAKNGKGVGGERVPSSAVAAAQPPPPVSTATAADKSDDATTASTRSRRVPTASPAPPSTTMTTAELNSSVSPTDNKVFDPSSFIVSPHQQQPLSAGSTAAAAAVSSSPNPEFMETIKPRMKMVATSSSSARVPSAFSSATNPASSPSPPSSAPMSAALPSQQQPSKARVRGAPLCYGAPM